MKQDIMIVGVGGQGTLLAGRLMGEYAKEQGLDAKVSEVHGMAQRGGSVVTHVRIGEKVYSPLVDVAGADALISFEPAEALRALEMLKPEGLLVCDSTIVAPVSVNMGQASYPVDVEECIAAYTPNAIFCAATEMAKALGNSRAANVVLLGVFCKKAGWDAQVMEKVIAANVKPDFVRLNVEAFQQGLQF